MATRLHSNRIEIGSLTTSQRNALSGVQEGTINNKKILRNG